LNVDRAFRDACRTLEIKMLTHGIHMAVMGCLCELGERRTMTCIARAEQVAGVREKFAAVRGGRFTG
jgi:hypothetical protein